MGGGGGKGFSHAEVNGGGGIKCWGSFNLRALAIIKGGGGGGGGLPCLEGGPGGGVQHFLDPLSFTREIKV